MSEEPFRPPPEPDPTTAPFWDAARRGELVVQRCRRCGLWVHYPRAVCPGCMESDLSFEAVSGRGSVYSFTWAHRPSGQAFAPRVPYVVALVELEEGVRLMTTLVDARPDDVAVGRPVRLAGFEPTVEDGPPVPVFSLA